MTERVLSELATSDSHSPTRNYIPTEEKATHVCTVYTERNKDYTGSHSRPVNAPSTGGRTHPDH